MLKNKDEALKDLALQVWVLFSVSHHPSRPPYLSSSPLTDPWGSSRGSNSSDQRVSKHSSTCLFASLQFSHQPSFFDQLLSVKIPFLLGLNQGRRGLGTKEGQQATLGINLAL